ncbi:MAG: sodium:proton antiporter [Pseudanabaena frigida]|uniref:Sodium:proton antiporter n=1 Tax=Pseudanabaena frigida TaxID=945775 RepID=A0A2W4WAN5_9CYAN|nr:MAG: sodium:proton antiporter [Pseudanabaena frigida]
MNFLTSASDVVIEEDLKKFLAILLIALGASILPKIFVVLRQVPYTLLLLMVGLGLALVDVHLLDLSPGLILMVFLPPLLFEAGWNTRWSELRENILPCSFYAVGGVLLSIASVGWALHQFMNIPWMVSLLVGACLAATDSAAVIGLFRDVGAGNRLTTLLEGESLFNDGASVVAFGILVELALDPQPFQLSTAILDFFVVTGIGLGIGGIIGVCVAFLTQRYELGWVEQTLTLATAYGTYLLVEELGGSGVIGVVTAGLVIGNFSVQPGVAPVKRSTMIEFWEFAIFFVNSILFLLLGDQIHLPRLIQNIQTTSIAILAIILSRAIAIYGFSALSNWLHQAKIPWREQTVLWWSGLRGSVSIALALSIPVMVMGRSEIIANSFGVVWFTLLVQGLTTKLLLQKLNLLEDRSLLQQYIELIARRDALEQVLIHLMRPQQLNIDPTLHQSQREFVEQQLQQIQIDIIYMQEQHQQLQAFSLQQHQEEILSIESRIYTKFVQAGLLKKSLSPFMHKAFNEG